jgi:serine/threonine protein kinase/Leucine-rich repeat (LRR) protein
MADENIEVVILEDGQVKERRVLPAGSYVVGSDPGCDIPLATQGVSAHHLRITFDAGATQVEDLNSETGTRVDGRPARRVTAVGPEQQVQIASIALRIRPLPGPPFQTPGKYRRGGLLARGGMGSIHLANDTQLDRLVAMKLLPPERLHDPGWVARFAEEARVTGQLEHPNIVPVHELAVNDDGQPYYTMKRVHGVTLQQILADLRQGKPETIAEYPLRRLLTILLKVCDGVAFAHSRRVLHRDLKPENIMIGDYGEVLVMDWGLARKIAHPAPGAGDAPPGRDRPPPADPPAGGGSFGAETAVVGTPQFMAPEQMEGRADDLDGRTDVYALGGILYNLLTLQPPHSGRTMLDIWKSLQAGGIRAPADFSARSGHPAADPADPESPRALPHCPGGRVPASLSAVAMKALSFAPADRYPTVKEFQREVESYLGGFATSAEEAGLGKLFMLWILRHRAETAILAASAIVLLGMGAGFVIRLAEEKNQALAEQRRAEAALRDLQATAPAFYAEASALVQEARFEEALNKITYAVSLAPDRAEYHLLEGHILQSLLRLAPAAESYQRALALDPGLTPARENRELCRALLAGQPAGETPRAESVFDLQAAMWRQGRTSEAQALLARLAADGGRVIERICRDRLQAAGLWDPTEVWLRVAAHGLVELNLSETDAADLRGLAGLPIVRLDLWRTQVTDLAPLRDLPLKDLGLGETPVTDLAPLRGLELTHLSLYKTAVRDINPLQGMPLEELSLSDTQVTDLGPLQGVPLTSLNLSRSRVSDLSPLRSRTLKKLDLSGCSAVIDLTPLADCLRLEELVLPEQCRDIEFLRQMPNLQLLSYQRKSSGRKWNPAQTVAEFWASRAITAAPEPPKTLDVSESSIHDLSTLNLDAVDSLNLKGTPVSDLRPLRGLPLKSIDLGGTRITGIEELRGMPLVHLSLYETGIRDIEPVRGMPLKQLILWGTPVADLSPLQGMELESCVLAGTPVRDLTPLAGMPIRKLDLSGCSNLTDLAPLAACQHLEELILPVQCRDIEFLRRMPRLTRLSYQKTGRGTGGPAQTTEEFWSEFDAKPRPPAGP